LLLALSHCSPSLLLVYPPTASLGKVRPDGLSRDFPISAKFSSMGNFKDRLTATQTPNWVAPSQESRPSSKTMPSRRGSVAPTRLFLAYPALGRHHPPVPTYIDLGRAFPVEAGSYLPHNSCLPCTRQAPPTHTFLAAVGRACPNKVGRAYPVISCLPCTRQAPPTRTYLYRPRSRLPREGRSFLPGRPCLPCTYTPGYEPSAGQLEPSYSIQLTIATKQPLHTYRTFTTYLLLSAPTK